MAKATPAAALAASLAWVAPAIPSFPPRPRLLLATLQRRPHAHISSTPVVARVAALDLRCSAGNAASAMVDTLLVAAYPLVDTLLVMRQFQATLSLEVVCLCSPCVHHLAMAPTTWSSRICNPLQACSVLCYSLYC